MSTFTKRTGASIDDCYFQSSVFTSTGALLLGYDTGNIYTGLRFLNVTIPQGATITSAKITFKASATSSTDVPAINIYGNDVDSSTAFSGSSPNRPQDKTKTTAVVSWSPAKWTADSLYDTPELKTIIQEIVDLAGWASDNAMSLMLLFSSGYGPRTAYSYDTDAATCPLLTIEYESSYVKTVNGLAKASVKTVKSLAIASVKTINGLA